MVLETNKYRIQSSVSLRMNNWYKWSVDEYRTVLLKVLQRNRTHTHTHKKRFIIRNWITKVWRLTPQNLQCGPVCLRPRRVDGEVPVQGPGAWRPRGANGADELCSHFPGEFPLTCESWSFSSTQAFNRLHEAHPHYREQSAYTEFTDLNVNLTQHTLQVGT